MAVGFRVDLDDRAARQLLRRFTRPEVDKILRKGSTRAGTAMKRVMRPAIPVGATGNLRGALKAKRIRANTSIGIVVGPMGKAAWYRHFVTGGTKPHRIPKSGKQVLLSTPYGVFPYVRHPGTKPNPWLDSVDGPAYAAGAAALQTAIDEALR